MPQIYLVDFGSGKSLIFFKVFRARFNRQGFITDVDVGFIFIDLDDIFYLEAQGNYTLFHMKSTGQHMVSKTLKTYTNLLKEFKFFRLNRSVIVNLKYVVGYTRQKSPTVTLSNGVTLSLSENRKKAFMEMFS